MVLRHVFGFLMLSLCLGQTTSPSRSPTPTPCSALPGYFCSGGAALLCPVGAFCAGGAALNISCYPVTACTVAGLSAQPPCYWSASTLAGNLTAMFADGQGTMATFNWPTSVVAVAAVVYVADNNNNRIRAVSPTGAVSTFAGSGICALTDGIGAAAGFCSPWGIAASPTGTLFIADIFNHAIRTVSPSGVVATFAGGTPGLFDGIGTSAHFWGPRGVTLDGAGVVYVADTWNSRIRTISPGGQVTTLSLLGGWLFFPHSVAVDGAGRLFVGDTYNDVVRLVLPNGTLTNFAGMTTGWADGTGTAAAFNKPMQISVLANGNMLVADQSNMRIRMVTPSREVTTIAGNWAASYWDGFGTSSLLFAPSGITANIAGIIYVADTNNACIRRFICVPCPASYYCSSGAPIICPAGSYCPLSSIDPTNCAVGTYSSTIGAASPSTCLPCPCASLCTTAGQTAAPSCSSTTSQTRTPATTTSPSRTKTPSPSRTLSPTASTPPCPASYYCFSGTPVLCPAGTYCPLSSVNATLCPKGSFSNAGASNCTLCPAGSFSTSTGSASCQQCPGGHFCPIGTSSWARLNCGRGNFCPYGSGTPTPCPPKVSPSGGWGALKVQGPAFIVETAYCLNHCFWNFTSGDGVLSKC